MNRYEQVPQTSSTGWQHFMEVYARTSRGIKRTVCKLLCAVIHKLDRAQFDVVLLSPSRRSDAWTTYARGDAAHPFMKGSARQGDGWAAQTEYVQLPNGVLDATAASELNAFILGECEVKKLQKLVYYLRII